MSFQWPAGFVRIPDQPWSAPSLEELASKYDTVESHGWYRNLDLTHGQPIRVSELSVREVRIVSALALLRQLI